MKTVILAGGLGSRMGSAFGDVPKALVPIAGRPVLRHVMDLFVAAGHADFVIALGHRGAAIRGHFGAGEPRVELVDTPPDCDTGGRLARLRTHLDGERFFLTWCDGLADVDLPALLDFHRSHGRIATVTAVHPPSRFGHLDLDGARVTRFVEKPLRSPEWINGAFFVLEPAIFELLDGDACSLEREVLPRLAERGELMAWRHESFWQCMDTPHEHALLESLCAAGRAPWLRGN